MSSPQSEQFSPESRKKEHDSPKDTGNFTETDLHYPPAETTAAATASGPSCVTLILRKNRGGTKSSFCTLTIEVESAITTGSRVPEMSQESRQAIGDGCGMWM